MFFILVIVVLGGLYAAGVIRLQRRGDSWPWGRTAAWFAGLLVLGIALLTGVGTYSYVLFSMHMVLHLVLSMLVPILLVLGAPATLALRALRPAKQRGDRGPREWLTAFLHGWYARLVTHPGFATPMFVISIYALYFTPLFGTLMQDHLGHVFMNVHFLLSGFLFYWIIIGVDPAPRKIPFLLRIVLLLVAMGFHAFFGVAIMMKSEPLGMEYYGQFEVPWRDSLADDQYAGGGVAWALGEIPTMLVLIALVVQWARDEERTERRRERHPQPARRFGDADLDAYNATWRRCTAGPASSRASRDRSSRNRNRNPRRGGPRACVNGQTGEGGRPQGGPLGVCVSPHPAGTPDAGGVLRRRGARLAAQQRGPTPSPRVAAPGAAQDASGRFLGRAGEPGRCGSPG